MENRPQQRPPSHLSVRFHGTYQHFRTNTMIPDWPGHVATWLGRDRELDGAGKVLSDGTPGQPYEGWQMAKRELSRYKSQQTISGVRAAAPWPPLLLAPFSFTNPPPSLSTSLCGVRPFPSHSARPDRASRKQQLLTP